MKTTKYILVGILLSLAQFSVAQLTKSKVDSLAKVMINGDTESYRFFQENQIRIDAVMGENYAHNQMIFTVYKTKIERHVANRDSDPDWRKIEADVKPYGRIGKEIFLKAKAIHYKNRKDWKNLVPAYDDYLKAFPDALDDLELNNLAWDVFNNVSDKKQLAIASRWSLKAIEIKKENQDEEYLDTYANLLHKLGNTREAIVREKEAITQAKQKGVAIANFEKALAKMEKGEATWK